MTVVFSFAASISRSLSWRILSRVLSMALVEMEIGVGTARTETGPCPPTSRLRTALAELRAAEPLALLLSDCFSWGARTRDAKSVCILLRTTCILLHTAYILLTWGPRTPSRTRDARTPFADPPPVIGRVRLVRDMGPLSS